MRGGLTSGPKAAKSMVSDCAANQSILVMCIHRELELFLLFAHAIFVSVSACIGVIGFVAAVQSRKHLWRAAQTSDA